MINTNPMYSRIAVNQFTILCLIIFSIVTIMCTNARSDSLSLLKEGYNWKVYNRTSRFEGASRILARNVAVEGSASLDFYCSDYGTPEINIETDDFLGASDEKRNVSLKFDDYAYINEEWQYSDKSAKFDHYRRPNLSDHYRILKDTVRLGVRLYTYDGHHYDYLFNLSGYDEVKTRMEEGCFGSLTKEALQHPFVVAPGDEDYRDSKIFRERERAEKSKAEYSDVNSSTPKGLQFKDFIAPEEKVSITNEAEYSEPGSKWYSHHKEFHDTVINGVNFAGHYAIKRLECGSKCVSVFVIDLKDGRVNKTSLGGEGVVSFNADWRTNSTLLKAHWVKYENGSYQCHTWQGAYNGNEFTKQSEELAGKADACN